MHIYGFTGDIEHGKSTAIRLGCELEPGAFSIESGDIITEVLDKLNPYAPSYLDIDKRRSINEWLSKLPPILSEVVHVDVSEKDIEFKEVDMSSDPIATKKLSNYIQAITTRPKLTESKVAEGRKSDYRPMLQWLGGYLVKKVHGGIWYNEVVDRLLKAEDAGTETAFVGGVRYRADAIILKQVGATIVDIHRPGWPTTDATDPTERERKSIPVDIKLINGGSEEELRNVIKVMLDDGKNNTHKQLYIA